MTPDPPRDCPRCPRLVAYRLANAARQPRWYNGAVPSFGDPDARLLVLPSGHGDYLAEASSTPADSDYAEITARLLDRFL